jgi:hypothetical protein
VWAATQVRDIINRTEITQSVEPTAVEDGTPVDRAPVHSRW